MSNEHPDDGLLRQLLEQQGEMRLQLERIEKHLEASLTKAAYTTTEVAERLGRSDWTVRQWCNLGQVRGAKKVRGRGRKGEWRIPHDELLRLQAEGPLSPTRVSRIAA